MTYTCEVCKGVFESDWSEVEATDEAKKLFGENFEYYNPDEAAMVCDDCFKQMEQQGLIPNQN